MTPPCRNPACPGGEFQPASWLNHVFCSHSCRQAWCRANGRNTAGEPHEPVTIVHKPGEIVMTITPDLSGYEQRMKDALRESRIVHAAGVIPPEVEQAVTAQIDQRHLAQAVVGHGWEHGDVVVICPVYPTPEPGWLKRLLRRLFE